MRLVLDTALPVNAIEASFARVADGEPCSRVLASSKEPGLLLGLISRIDLFRTTFSPSNEFSVEFASSHPDLGGTVEISFPAASSTSENVPPVQSIPTASSARLTHKAKQPRVARLPPPLNSDAYLGSLREACSLLGLPEECVGGGAQAAVQRAAAATAWAAQQASGSMAAANVEGTPVRPSMHATAAKRSRDEQPQPFASPILGRGGGPDSCPQSLDRTTKHHRMAPARGGRSDEASVAVTPNLKL